MKIPSELSTTIPLESVDLRGVLPVVCREVGEKQPYMTGLNPAFRVFPLIAISLTLRLRSY